MKSEKLFFAIGDIDGSLIEDAMEVKIVKEKIRNRIKITAIAACICLLVAGAALGVMELSGPVIKESLVGTTARVTKGDRGIKYTPVAFDLEDISEREMFTGSGMNYFRGRVSEIENFTADFGKDKEYFAVATIKVTEHYGNTDIFESVKLLLPCPIGNDGLQIEDSGVISKLRAGMEGIFMTRSIDRDSRMEKYGKAVYYDEFAEQKVLDGERWVFLDTGDGIEYYEDAHPSAGELRTLEDAEEYVKQMLRKHN